MSTNSPYTDYNPISINNQYDERVFPIVPFLTGLVVGPLLYQAFNPYYGYPYPLPYPVPIPYYYNYSYGSDYTRN
ncbi:hypothetical protein [Ornithinibacillus sp. 179-J 7C1 HS]|uniref:hypothetical protein n=1 Tax=Ornithinibacillus sp. 179-J 7C1 HS TaxID=3142384 RepID=UPI0039A139E5